MPAMDRGAVAALDDEEEWINIPAVVRAVLYRLRDESSAHQQQLVQLRLRQQELYAFTEDCRAESERATAKKISRLHQEQRKSNEALVEAWSGLGAKVAEVAAELPQHRIQAQKDMREVQAQEEASRAAMQQSLFTRCAAEMQLAREEAVRATRALVTEEVDALRRELRDCIREEVSKAERRLHDEAQRERAEWLRGFMDDQATRQRQCTEAAGHAAVAQLRQEQQPLLQDVEAVRSHLRTVETAVLDRVDEVKGAVRQMVNQLGEAARQQVEQLRIATSEKLGAVDRGLDTAQRVSEALQQRVDERLGAVQAEVRVLAEDVERRHATCMEAVQVACSAAPRRGRRRRAVDEDVVSSTTATSRSRSGYSSDLDDRRAMAERGPARGRSSQSRHRCGTSNHRPRHARASPSPPSLGQPQPVALSALEQRMLQFLEAYDRRAQSPAPLTAAAAAVDAGASMEWVRGMLQQHEEAVSHLRGASADALRDAADSLSLVQQLRSEADALKAKADLTQQRQAAALAAVEERVEQRVALLYRREQQRLAAAEGADVESLRLLRDRVQLLETNVAVLKDLLGQVSDNTDVLAAQVHQRLQPGLEQVEHLIGCAPAAAWRRPRSLSPISDSPHSTSRSSDSEAPAGSAPTEGVWLTNAKRRLQRSVRCGRHRRRAAVETLAAEVAHLRRTVSAVQHRVALAETPPDERRGWRSPSPHGPAGGADEQRHREMDAAVEALHRRVAAVEAAQQWLPREGVVPPPPPSRGTSAQTVVTLHGASSPSQTTLVIQHPPGALAVRPAGDAGDLAAADAVAAVAPSAGAAVAPPDPPMDPHTLAQLRKRLDSMESLVRTQDEELVRWAAFRSSTQCRLAELSGVEQRLDALAQGQRAASAASQSPPRWQEPLEHLREEVAAVRAEVRAAVTSASHVTRSVAGEACERLRRDADVDQQRAAQQTRQLLEELRGSLWGDVLEVVRQRVEVATSAATAAAATSTGPLRDEVGELQRWRDGEVAAQRSHRRAQEALRQEWDEALRGTRGDVAALAARVDAAESTRQAEMDELATTRDAVAQLRAAVAEAEVAAAAAAGPLQPPPPGAADAPAVAALEEFTRAAVREELGRLERWRAQWEATVTAQSAAVAQRLGEVEQRTGRIVEATERAVAELRAEHRDAVEAQRTDLAAQVRRCEARMAEAVQAASSPGVPRELPAAQLEEQRRWVAAAVERELRDVYRTTQLDERFQNMWESFVQLLARKEDQAALAAKLEQLRLRVLNDMSAAVNEKLLVVQAMLDEKVGRGEQPPSPPRRDRR